MTTLFLILKILGYWTLLAILLAAIYSAIRTCEKKREERAANHQGGITL